MAYLLLSFVRTRVTDTPLFHNNEAWTTYSVCRSTFFHQGKHQQRQEKSLDNRSGRAGQTLFRMSEHESGCPTLRAVRSVGIWQFELMTEHEIEIRGTHLSKTAKGGATGHLQLCIQKRRVYPITLLASSRYMRARRRASAGSMTRNQNIVLRPRE